MLVIAHRGASAYAPENTLASFELALRQGADGVELDARLTADRQVIVMHDAAVDRTTNGTGPVERMPLSTVRNLDAGGWFGPQYAGERAPTLAEVLDLCHGRALVDIEMKSAHPLALGLAHRVVEEIDRTGARQQVIVTSFNPLALAEVRRLRPAIPTGLLYTGRKGRARARRVYAPWLHPAIMLPHDSVGSPPFIRYWHALHRLVYIWTVDGEQRMRQLCLAGADGIITNRPDLLRTVRDGLVSARFT